MGTHTISALSFNDMTLSNRKLCVSPFLQRSHRLDADLLGEQGFQPREFR